jgi:hypothetical protein
MFQFHSFQNEPNLWLLVSLKLPGESSVFCSNIVQAHHNHAFWLPCKNGKAWLSAVLSALPWAEGQRYTLWPQPEMCIDWPTGVILVELFEDQCHARLLQNTRWQVVGAILQFWGYWIDGEFAPAKVHGIPGNSTIVCVINFQ